MASFIGEFLVKLGFANDTASAKKAEQDIDNVGSAVTSLGDKLETLKGTFAAVGSLFAGSQIVGYVTDAADKFDQLGIAAKNFGMTAEDLGALSFAFEQAGVEADYLYDSLENMVDYVGQAKLGTGDGKEALDALGISITDNNGHIKDTIVLFDELVGKLDGLDHATQVTYINMLGMQTQTMAALKQGSAELLKQRQLYIDTYAAAGVNINEAAAQARAFNQAFDLVNQTIEMITSAIGTRFFTITTSTLTMLRQKLVENIGKITAVLTSLMKVVMAIAKAFLAVATTAIEVASSIFDWWTRTSTLFKTTVGIIGAITAALVLMNSAFMKSPIGRLLAIAAVIGAIIDDFRVWKEGGNSLIGELIGGFEEVHAALNDLSPIFGWLISNLDAVVLAIAGIPIALKGAGMAFGLLQGTVAPVLSALKLFGPVLSVVTTGFKLLGAAMLGTPIGWILAAIAALVAAGIYLYNNWDEVTKALGAAWDWVTQKISAAIQWISDLFNSFVAYITSIPSRIAAGWEQLFNWFAEKFNFLAKGFDTIKKGASKLMSVLGFGDDESEADTSEQPPQEQGEKQSSTTAQTTVPSAEVTQDNAAQIESELLAPTQKQPAYLQVQEYPEITPLKPLDMQFESVPDLAPVQPIFHYADGTPTGATPIPASYTPPPADSLDLGALQNNLATVAPLELPQVPPVDMTPLNNMASNLELPATVPPNVNNTTEQTVTVTQNNGDTNISILAAETPQATAEAVAQQQQVVQDTAVRNLRRQMQ